LQAGIYFGEAFAPRKFRKRIKGKHQEISLPTSMKQLARQFKLLSQLFSATRRADKKIRRRKFSLFKYIFLILHRS